MSYPCLLREVDCDGEVLFVRLPPVCLWVVWAGFTLGCHGDALLLCFLLVFFNFLLTSGDNMSDMRLQICPQYIIKANPEHILAKILFYFSTY